MDGKSYTDFTATAHETADNFRIMYLREISTVNSKRTEKHKVFKKCGIHNAMDNLVLKTTYFLKTMTITRRVKTN